MDKRKQRNIGIIIIAISLMAVVSGIAFADRGGQLRFYSKPKRILPTLPNSHKAIERINYERHNAWFHSGIKKNTWIAIGGSAFIFIDLGNKKENKRS